MQFGSTRSDTSSRLLELRNIHRRIALNEANLPVPIEHAALKGHFIVGLYAYLEFSLTTLIRSAVFLINSKSILHKHLSLDLLTLLMDAKFTSASMLSGEKKWSKRHELVIGLYGNSNCVISDSVLSREVQNTRAHTIDLVFKLFSINQPAVFDGPTRGYINEIGDRRNAVAHGRESASDVGGRFSSGNLEVRLNSLESQVTHMISCFEDAVSKRSFIRVGCRKFYP